jgi:hypothetical protein
LGNRTVWAYWYDPDYDIDGIDGDVEELDDGPKDLLRGKEERDGDAETRKRMKAAGFL